MKLNEAEKFVCEDCGKDFLVVPQEKGFYKSKSLPMPKKCSECRRGRRADSRNERKLYDRGCDKCDAQLKSTYPSDSKYTVYCEKCYFESLG